MKAVVNVETKKWDVEAYKQKAKEREAKAAEEKAARDAAPPGKKKRVWNFPELKPKDGKGGPQRDYLTARNYDLNLENGIGKRTFTNQSTENAADKSGESGFYCKVCDINFKDSLSYVSHINGKKHQKMCGVSMVVEKTTLEEVSNKFAELKEKKDRDDVGRTLEIEDRMRKRQIEWEKGERERRLAKRQAKKQKRNQENEDTTEEIDADAEMMKVMGFSGFK